MSKWIVVAMSATIAVAALVMEMNESRLLRVLCREDGVIENFQALLYLLASMCMAIGAVRLRSRALIYAGYAMLFFLVAGEEISWGQRIFGIETPEAIAEKNVQGETNLHNLAGIHGIVRMIGLLIVLGTTVVIPLLDRFVPWARDLIRRWRFPVFPMWGNFIVALAIGLMVVPRVFGMEMFRLDEMGELLLAGAFLVFGIDAMWRASCEPNVNATREQPIATAV